MNHSVLSSVGLKNGGLPILPGRWLFFPQNKVDCWKRGQAGGKTDWSNPFVERLASLGGQMHRYEAGEEQPSCSVSVCIKPPLPLPSF